MSSIVCQTYISPLGSLNIGVFDDQLCLLDWTYRKKRLQIDRRVQSFCNASFENGMHELISETIVQLQDYFNGDRTSFDLPLLHCGSDFQQSVWKDLMTIPYGETMSYSSLSRKRNNPKSIRAVAGANGANAIAIIVPCHRVIASNGALTGYAGGLKAKEQLLKLERIDLSHGQQSLF